MKSITNIELKKNIKLSTIALCAGQCLVFAPAAFAQGSVSEKSLEKTRFYNAPREIQIVDERPVIRDFREAPTNPGQIALPPGPGGGGGPGAGGLGSLGGGNGANVTLPAGGLPIGGPGPGYRNAPTGIGTLPKSGFGSSNIPARGLGPRGILPGVTTGVVGKVMSQNPVKQTAGAPAKGLSLKGPSGGGRPSGGPSVASYGGYGNNPTSYGRDSRTEKNVRGYLLNHK